MPGPRYAIYYAPPPGSALERFGRDWLGRDVDSGASVPALRIDGIDPGRQQAITADPRHYGFHGTLKPPFALAAGRTPDELEAAAAAFASARRSFQAPPLELARLSGFLALVPSGPSPALAELAADCVRAFDGFRAPPPETELARRRRAGLSPAQEANLLRWGYPYVLDQFRFHLTLTERLDDGEAEEVRRKLAGVVAPLCAQPFTVDAVNLFVQEDRSEPFRLARRFAFAEER